MTLAGSAADLWDLLAEPRTAAELTGELAERYGASSDEVHSDIVLALGDLAAKGLVRLDR